MSIKHEEVEETVSGSSLCDTTHGAKAKHETPEPPAPSKPTLGKTQPKVEDDDDDDDDVLTGLCALFDGLHHDDTESDGSESSDSEPGSPRCRAIDSPSFISDFGLGFPELRTRTYFMHGGNSYFFDQEHNVFLECGQNIKQIHWGQQFLSDSILEFEMIEGLPYYFGLEDTLWSIEDPTYQVKTWVVSAYDQIFNSALSGGLADTFPAPFAPSLDFDYQELGQFQLSNGDYSADQLLFDPGTFQSSPPDQPPLTFSPSSSMAHSPIVSSDSRATSSEPSSPPLIRPRSQFVGQWKEDIKHIQEDRNNLSSNKLDRRRCRHCNKVFRRPSSLADHLNVHSGAKPNMCPFERCNTGFATKSNMKRHFLTHRVGRLEDYHGGKPDTVNLARTATYNAKAFHTQRFRLVPNEPGFPHVEDRLQA